MMMAGWYSVEEDPQTKEEVRRTVLAFSPSRRVRAKIALGDLGFGPAYVAIDKTRALFKNSVKALLHALPPAPLGMRLIVVAAVVALVGYSLSYALWLNSSERNRLRQTLRGAWKTAGLTRP
jgi:hypothetical protein